MWQIFKPFKLNIMTCKIIQKSEIKAKLFTKNVDIAIKHQNYFRNKSGKTSNIEDQTDFPKTKKNVL